jgi:hypothetical protein
VRFLRGTGACTVYVQSDYDPANAVPFLCDAVVCSSEYLANFYRTHGAANVSYIPDPAEFWRKPDEGTATRPVERNLALCWIGHPGNWETLAPIRQILAETEFSDIRLVTVSSHPEADVPWSLAAVQDVVNRCDLAVVPTGKGAQAFSKSSNRVIMFMAAGVPVIAGRIPAYEEVIEHGLNGYLADTLEEYRMALRALRDPEARRRVAHRAYDSVNAEYTIDSITHRWLELFRSLESQRDTSQAYAWSDEVRGKPLWAALAVLSRLELTLLALAREDYRAALSCFCSALPLVPICPASLRDVAGVCGYVIRGAMRRASDRWNELRQRWARNS